MTISTIFNEFSENYVALFATKFFGVQQPHPFSLPKKRNEIFRIGNDPWPPPPSEVFRKFIKFGPGIRPLGPVVKKFTDMPKILLKTPKIQNVFLHILCSEMNLY